MTVGRVDEHRDAHLLTEPLGEADVVAVAVGQDQTADVRERTTDVVELALKVVPVPGEARVDQGDALGQVDEVRGDDVVADAVQVGGELHGGSSRSVCDGYVT